VSDEKTKKPGCNPSSRKTKPPLRAVNEESQQSRACGVLYLVAGTNGKNLNRQDAKFAKLDRWLDKKEEDGNSCQGRPHEPVNQNRTTDFTDGHGWARMVCVDPTAIKLGKSQARFPFKQGKSRLGSWMEKISTTEDTENTEVLVRNQ
jgi:hypothetical protein